MASISERAMRRTSSLSSRSTVVELTVQPVSVSAPASFARPLHAIAPESWLAAVVRDGEHEYAIRFLGVQHSVRVGAAGRRPESLWAVEWPMLYAFAS